MAELKIGLEGVAIAETKICFIDGVAGKLIYRGHAVEDIVREKNFEEVVYLLWYGRYPNATEKQDFTRALAALRNLPDNMKQIVDACPKELDCMSVLRTVLSSMIVDNNSWPPTVEQAMKILAIAPTIVAYFYHKKNGSAMVNPDPTLGHVANYLYMLTGKPPERSHERALEAYLMLSAEHGMNASTFTARVVTSTQSDIVSAIVAAIGSLKGPLHGGAPSKVDQMLDEIKTPDNVEAWLRNKLEHGERIMGFGHRVYKTYDPRAAALKKIVQEFAQGNALFELSLILEDKAIELLEEYKPGRRLYPNVEFWAAGVLRTILPRELYTPTFCTSRIAGWSANILEQASNNRIIRPTSIYIGDMPGKS